MTSIIRNNFFSLPSRGLILILTILINLQIVPISEAGNDLPSVSVTCAIRASDTKTNQLAECDYRYTLSPPEFPEFKDVVLEIAGKATEISKITPYPSDGQATALLFLVDSSDPKRQDTVKKNVEAIRTILTNRKSHHKVGVATFDSEFHLLSPIGNDFSAAEKALNSIKADGLATEFYKNIINGIEVLQKTEASRKVLILMSDGKAEDRAYKHEDAVDAAKKAGVSIMGLGYPERPSDTPNLQTLQRLAEETDGIYFTIFATDKVLPPALTSHPFAFIEQGGRISFPIDTLFGQQEISITLQTADGKNVKATTSVNFPDLRTTSTQVKDTTKQYWPFILAGIAFLLVVLVLLWRARSRRRAALLSVVEYAFLDELSSSKTRHVLTKTASRVGRDSDNDVCLANDSLSAHHAEIHRRREGLFYIVDLASTNGVYVNDIKKEQAELHDGDIIELGEVRLRFSCQ